MKRPFVWCFLGLLFLFLTYRYFYGPKDDEKNYCLSAVETQLKHSFVTGTIEEVTERTSGMSLVLSDVQIGGNDFKVPRNPKKLLVIVKSSVAVQPGFVGTFQGAISKIQAPGNPGQFHQQEYYEQINIYYEMVAEQGHIQQKKTTLKGVLYQFRRRIANVYTICLPTNEAGIASAMFLGEKQFLEAEIKELYKQSGISHLLSISGLHVALLGMGCFQVLRFLMKKWAPAVAITLLLLFVYGMMTGFGISTSRAVIMMTLSMAAIIVGRSYDSLSAMAFSAIVILLQKPFAVYSCSFLLSYSAVFGLFFVRPYLELLLLGDDVAKRKYYRKKHREKTENRQNAKYPFLVEQKEKIIYGIVELLLGSCSIQIASLPIVLYFFYEFPVYGIFMNLIVIPLSSFVLLLCIFGGLVGLFSLPVAKFLLGSVYLLLRLYETVCRLFAKLPYHTIITGRPKVWKVLLYYGCLMVLIFSPKIVSTCEEFIEKKSKNHKMWQVPKMGYVILFIIQCVMLVFIALPEKPSCLQIDFMDVGQGDGILIRNELNHVFLMDGGSTTVKNVGKYRLIPCLKYYGIHHIDAMIMSHPDEDHINGLLEIIQMSDTSGITVGRLLMPMMQSEESNYQKMVQAAKDHNIPIQYITTGDAIRDGTLTMECLNPQMEFESKSSNAYSVTISLSYGAYKTLLTGDLEGDGEEDVRQLLAERASVGETGYDILKVAHHGSKNATSEQFLEVCRPQYAILSCGEGNRYGHPNPELLQRLSDAEAECYSTKDVGDIIVRFEQEGIILKGFRMS